MFHSIAFLLDLDAHWIFIRSLPFYVLKILMINRFGLVIDISISEPFLRFTDISEMFCISYRIYAFTVSYVTFWCLPSIFGVNSIFVSLLCVVDSVLFLVLDLLDPHPCLPLPLVFIIYYLLFIIYYCYYLFFFSNCNVVD